MITYENVRYKSGHPYPLPTQTGTPLRALETLAFCDFTFGGRVSDVTVTDETITIKTSTSVLGDLDISTYSGSHHNMRLLLKLSQYVTAAQADSECQQVILDAAMAKVSLDKLLLRPIYIRMAAGLMMGEGLTRAALAAIFVEECYGEDEAKLEEMIEAIAKLRHKDIFMAFDLAMSENVDLLIVLSMAAPLTEAA